MPTGAERQDGSLGKFGWLVHWCFLSIWPGAWCQFQAPLGQVVGHLLVWRCDEQIIRETSQNRTVSWTFLLRFDEQSLDDFGGMLPN